MPRRTTRHRRVAPLLAIATAGVFVLAGCGNGSSSDTADAGSSAGSGSPCGTTENTTLTVGLFGTFGFKEAGLWDAYKKVCPNITIKEDVVEQSADYWTRLKTRLASSSGLADVQAIEIGFVADVVQNHGEDFVNWNTVPNAAADKAEFYPWKWEQASTNDGKTTVGSRHRHRPGGDLLPQRPPQEGRAPVRPQDARHQVDDLGRLHRLRQAVRGVEQPSPRARTSSTARRASSPPPSTRAMRPTPTRTATPTSRTATASRTRGTTRPRPLRTASPPASSSSPPRGTRRSPAARSQRWPAPRG